MLTGSIIGDIKYQFRNGNMVMRLLFVNVGVFLFFGLFNVFGWLAQSNGAYNFLLTKLESPASLQTLIHQPWSVFTYMFLHTNLWHVGSNMLFLYWFGDIFVLYLSDKKVLPLYILGGLSGALVYMLAFNFIPVFKPQLDYSFLLGASASIMAIVFAAATINPDHEVGLLLLGRVKIKYIAIVPLLLGFISIPNGNAGGNFAHVGGALFGYLYITSLRSGFDPGAPFVSFFNWLAALFKRKPSVKVSYKNVETKRNTTPTRDKADQAKVDEILDKIARSGYDSLTKEEKDFLFNYSKK